VESTGAQGRSTLWAPGALAQRGTRAGGLRCGRGMRKNGGEEAYSAAMFTPSIPRSNRPASLVRFLHLGSLGRLECLGDPGFMIFGLVLENRTDSTCFHMSGSEFVGLPAPKSIKSWAGEDQLRWANPTASWIKLRTSKKNRKPLNPLRPVSRFQHVFLIVHCLAIFSGVAVAEAMW
jgi:hypothetical protein